MCTRPGSEKFVTENHAEVLLRSLYEFRSNQDFCDVIIEVDEMEFFCHKNVLAGAIPYFKTMFKSNYKEADQKRVRITSLNSEMMSLILDYIYTGSIDFTVDNSKGLFSAAEYLGVSVVQKAACAFLEKRINDNNCLGIYSLPELSNSATLKQNALQHALRNFENVCKQEEFLDLTEEKLISILQSDDLVVQDEKAVFCAVMKWYNAQSENEEIKLYVIIEKVVRLCLLDTYFLCDCLKHFPELSGSPEVMKLIEDAKLFHLLHDRNSNNFIPQSRPRNHSGVTEVIMMIGKSRKRSLESEVYYYQPISNKLYKLKRLPDEWRVANAVTSNNKTYAITGSSEHLYSFWQYCMESDSWIRRRPPEKPVADGRLVSLDGRVYIVGTRTVERSSSIERFDSNRNCWDFVSNLETLKHTPVLIAHNGMLYVIGGGEKQNELLRYDFFSNSCTSLPSMSCSRAQAAGCVFMDHIYMFGGIEFHYNQDIEPQYLNSAERYNVNSEKWESIPSMKEPRYLHGVAVVNGKIYVLGGRTSIAVYTLSTVECYDPASNEWEDVKEIPKHQLSNDMYTYEFCYTTAKINKSVKF